MLLHTLRQSPENKSTGAYYTPPAVVERLAKWAARGGAAASVLDPACGDGRFLSGLQGATGIDLDAKAVRIARDNLPDARLFHADFFTWASRTSDRFDAVVGNPPFVRYQSFTGAPRRQALDYCRRVGVQLSGLASSWAPFVVASASLLQPGGRLAFVVPAEISYAVYARPVLRYLLGNFSRVGLIATRQRLFGHLSEECWLLLADGHGAPAKGLHLRLQDALGSPPEAIDSRFVTLAELQEEGFRIRPFLLGATALSEYRRLSRLADVHRLGDLASLGIGYVTGANDFFHLRPSEAAAHRIPPELLRPAVRTGKDLGHGHIDAAIIASWYKQDRPYLLLDLSGVGGLTPALEAYLTSSRAVEARTSYKCSTRTPWYRIPDVTVPDAFLSIMSTTGPRLAANYAGAACSNSVHAVVFRSPEAQGNVIAAWQHPLVQLSAEIEGHALGGGMLKLEPAEARRILIPFGEAAVKADHALLAAALSDLRRWRTNG